MNFDSPVPVKDLKERHNSLVEVDKAEKELWGLVHSKGLLHTDVQNLFRKVRSAYERIILNDHKVVELQDVEYSLWKLHYKHIDEFRTRIRKDSANLDNGKCYSQIEGFKSFLSEATDFYQDLIKKLRRSCGLPEELSYFKRAGLPFSIKPEKLEKCQYSCHRFLVCLGDLARYSELSKKPNLQNCNWSIAATNYFKATMVWPDGGNPQNQLALLATYVGDDFLALYHCVRSLAVKEPFPDAWDNLILLFEKNRLSSPLHSPSGEARFDFLKPSERSSILQTESQTPLKDSSNGDGLEATEHVSCGKNDLWPLFVRTISFFFIDSSLEDFPFTFGSMVRELEALLRLDDTELKAKFESDQQMDSARTGPYRALQTVSVLIFVIHSLKESPEVKDSEERENMHKTTLTELALTATFIFMGRLLERCLKSSFLDVCPILPSVLVFVEWLACTIDEAEEQYGNDEKVLGAMSYFFGTYVHFLNRLGKIEGGVNSQYDHIVLWEDFELRGFAPIADSHVSLDFEVGLETMSDFSSGNVSRAHRIFCAAMKIVERSNDSRKWIFYNKVERKFYTSDIEREIPGENLSHPCGNGNSLANEDEEVILFKPIMRHNSVPIYTSITTTDQICTEGPRDEKVTSDVNLRRASSLCNKPSRQPEPPLKDSTMYPAGPPSLSAWVLDRESPDTGREKGRKEFTKHGLSPIEETASDFTGLSINETEDSPFNYSSPPYLAPVPSAPLLPEDAIWLTGNSSNFSESKNLEDIKEKNGILGASPLNRVPGLINQYPTLGMSSSEWLRHYTNNQNLSRANNNHTWPVHFYAPGNNFNGYDASRFDVFDQWGNVLAANQMVYLESPQLHQCSPLSYGADEHRREKPFLGYQRPSPYVYGGAPELRVEQPPLVHYLKEREWQLQRESQVRGPTYLGN